MRLVSDTLMPFSEEHCRRISEAKRRRDAYSGTMLTTSKAIEELQQALAPVTLAAPITAAQIAEQVRLYLAAAENYEAACEAVRAAAAGPRPEFVRGGK